ncbi:FKBP-type peptidyl-prolyl cis-trans isomerase [Vibrio crassostreae]|uniref:FKBP-type peptidyl-prolyl cis-trans isomerase n=1 Tax=Vibrio crassostreae TaxID=246167 RepID=UPI001B30823E|nr:FKBP-type peptidyl-prolyl cis-trans isomerase [Vibrio crassostreae]
MSLKYLSLLIPLICSTSFASDDFFAVAENLSETIERKESYSIGYEYAASLVLTLKEQEKKSGYKFENDAVTLGFTDRLNNLEPKISAADRSRHLATLDYKLAEMIKTRDDLIEQRNCQIGLDTQIQSKSIDGAKELSSGVIIRQVYSGEETDIEISSIDTVTISYKVKLASGELVDQAGLLNPLKTKVGDLIIGLQIAVKSMRVGGKYQVVVPPEVGFIGNKRYAVPPCSTLVFEVDLLKVEHAPNLSSLPPATQPKLLN